MKSNLYLLVNVSLNEHENSKTVEKEEEKEEQEEEERMKRIFDLVPRRKRSLRVPKPHVPDFSKIPRKKRTPYTYMKTPKWLIQVMSDMKVVCHPMLIIHKTLDLNDVNPSLNRLSIPFLNLNRNDFLTFDESKILGEECINNDGKMGVGAFLVDQRTKQWNVFLKKWVMRTDSSKISRCYLLSGEWSDVVKANGLRDDDNISLWSFRCHEILFFALDFAGDSVDF